MHRITFQSNARYRGVTLDGEDRSDTMKREGKGDHWASHDRALAGKRSQAGTARLDGPGRGMDRACVPSQRRLHAGAVLSILRYAEPGPSAAFRQGIACSQTGRRDRVADYERRSEDMPHIEQGDLPGARSREHPPPPTGQQPGCHAAAFVAGFCAGTSGYEQPCCTDRDGNGIPPFPKR